MKYIKAFKDFLIVGLRNKEEYQVQIESYYSSDSL